MTTTVIIVPANEYKNGRKFDTAFAVLIGLNVTTTVIIVPANEYKNGRIFDTAFAVLIEDRLIDNSD